MGECSGLVQKLTKQVLETIQKENIVQTAQAFSKWKRASASKDAEAAAAYLISKLKEYGIPNKRLEFTGYMSSAVSAKLKMLSPEIREFEVVPCGFTRNVEDIQGELCYDYMGESKTHTPEQNVRRFAEFKDKIVLTKEYCSDIAYEAAAAGALGIIGMYNSPEEVPHYFGASNHNGTPTVSYTHLTRKIRGTNLFRTVFFMPNLIGGVVLGYIWSILLNCVLSLLAKPLLRLDATYGFWGLILLMCWQQIGYMMIIYIAGLQSIPNDYLEAAYIDGANSWQTLWRVKIPNVMPSITICLFLTLTNSFKLFDQNLALTGGEPAHMTEMLALNIYNTFYGRSGAQWKGYGQAKAVIFCVLVIVISMIQLRATRSKEVQQ